MTSWLKNERYPGYVQSLVIFDAISIMISNDWLISNKAI
jgi:hypothetical protein